MTANGTDLAVIVVGLLLALLLSGAARLGQSGRHDDRAFPGEPIMLSRGTVVMSRASLAALSPEIRAHIEKTSDIVTAEDALAELDEECAR